MTNDSVKPELPILCRQNASRGDIPADLSFLDAQCFKLARESDCCFEEITCTLMQYEVGQLVSRGYSLGSRAACLAAKAVQYGLVGLVMGITGSSFVLGLTSLRTAVDKTYKPPPTYQPVLGTGLGWLLFMSGNSNIRYNLINLLEDISYERYHQSCWLPCNSPPGAHASQAVQTKTKVDQN